MEEAAAEIGGVCVKSLSDRSQLVSISSRYNERLMAISQPPP
jgi:hypothetical protein